MWAVTIAVAVATRRYLELPMLGVRDCVLALFDWRAHRGAALVAQPSQAERVEEGSR